MNKSFHQGKINIPFCLFLQSSILIISIEYGDMFVWNDLISIFKIYLNCCFQLN